jgi:hypothetical protein
MRTGKSSPIPPIIQLLFFLVVAFFLLRTFAPPVERLAVILPTPPATALPWETQLEIIARDRPAGKVNNTAVPVVDPDIAFLLDQVSQQNLKGYIQTLESFGTRHTFSETELDNFGIGAARRWISDEFVRVGNGRLRVESQPYSFVFQGIFTTQENIIATLPGTSDHAGVIVLMANYDTRAEDIIDGESLSPGADDNASGIANLLEVARLMSSRTWNQTIVFAALTAEEQGTYGSRHFVQEAFLNYMPVDAGINNDMIGGRAGISQFARLYAFDLHGSNNGQLARYIKHMGELYVPNFPINLIDGLDREGRWGDQREFVNAGYPAVRIIESEEDLSIQNSERDTWSLIDYDYLQTMVQLNLATVANLVSVPPPQPPTVARLPEPGSFELAWTPDPNVSGCAISFRPFANPDFPPFLYVSGDDIGRVQVSGMDPQEWYAVSFACQDEAGRMGLFSSPEVIIEPTP